MRVVVLITDDSDNQYRGEGPTLTTALDDISRKATKVAIQRHKAERHAQDVVWAVNHASRGQ